MDITPLIPKNKQLITGYGGGGFKINHEFVAGSLLVLPDQMLPWEVTDAANITLPALHAILHHNASIELLLIGTGIRTALIDPAIRQLFKSKGIATDVMDTGAACRTFNVLLSEGRKAAAAVIAV